MIATDQALDAAHADPCHAWPQWDRTPAELARAEREADALRRALEASDRALAERRARRAARGAR